MRKLSPVKKLVLALTVGVLATGSLTACLPSVDKADAKPSATSSAVGAKKPGSAASPDSKEALTKNIEIGKAHFVKSHLGDNHVRFSVTNKNKKPVWATYTLTLKAITSTDGYGEPAEEEKELSYTRKGSRKDGFAFSSFCSILSSGETCEADLSLNSSDWTGIRDINVSIYDIVVFDSDTWFDCSDGMEVKYLVGKASARGTDYIEAEPGAPTDGGVKVKYIFTNKTHHYIKFVSFDTIYYGETTRFRRQGNDHQAGDYAIDGHLNEFFNYINYVKPGDTKEEIEEADTLSYTLFTKPEGSEKSYEKYGFHSYQEILDLRQTRAYCSIDESKE